MSRRSRAIKTAEEPFCSPLIWLAIGVLLTLVLIGGWFMNRAPAESGAGTLGPRLVVNQERVDVGTQPFNKLVRAEFTLTNEGDRTLQLDASSPVRVLEGC
jgi:hypothetical protein